MNIINILITYAIWKTVIVYQCVMSLYHKHFDKFLSQISQSISRPYNVIDISFDNYIKEEK